MPKSKEKDAGKNIKRLIKKGMPQKQAVAVGLDEARRAGADVPPKPEKKSSKAKTKTKQ